MGYYIVKKTDIVCCMPVEEVVNYIEQKIGDDFTKYLWLKKKVKKNYGDYQFYDDNDKQWYPISKLKGYYVLAKHRNVFLKSKEWVEDKYWDINHSMYVIKDDNYKEKVEELNKLLLK